MLLLTSSNRRYNKHIILNVDDSKNRSVLGIPKWGLGSLTARGLGSIPGRGTEIPQATGHGQNKNENKQTKTGLY